MTIDVPHAVRNALRDVVLAVAAWYLTYEFDAMGQLVVYPVERVLLVSFVAFLSGHSAVWTGAWVVAAVNLTRMSIPAGFVAERVAAYMHAAVALSSTFTVLNQWLVYKTNPQVRMVLMRKGHMEVAGMRADEAVVLGRLRNLERSITAIRAYTCFDCWRTAYRGGASHVPSYVNNLVRDCCGGTCQCADCLRKRLGMLEACARCFVARAAGEKTTLLEFKARAEYSRVVHALPAGRVAVRRATLAVGVEHDVLHGAARKPRAVRRARKQDRRDGVQHGDADRARRARSAAEYPRGERRDHHEKKHEHVDLVRDARAALRERLHIFRVVRVPSAKHEAAHERERRRGDAEGRVEPRDRV